MFSRVVEGADPYRGIEKPFISSPPRCCANNVTAGCKHTPLRSVASLLRKYVIAPTDYILFRTVGAIHESPVKKQRREPNSTAAHSHFKPPLCKGRWHFRKKMTEGLAVRKAEQRTTLNTSRQPLSRSAPAPLTQGSLWLSANIG